MIVTHQTACIANPVMIDNFASLFYDIMVSQGSQAE